MKKIAALVSALLLVCSISGCSKEDVPTSLPETECDAAQTAASEETSEPPIELDVFSSENFVVSYKSILTAGGYPYYLSVNAKNSDYKVKFICSVLSATPEKFTFEVAVDEERAEQWLRENNYVLAEISKEYEVSISEVAHYLLSQNELTEEVVDELLTGLEQEVQYKLKPLFPMDDDDYETIPLYLVALYTVLPPEDMEFAELNDANYSTDVFQGLEIHSSMDCAFYRVYAIFTDNNSNYYTVYAAPAFDSDGTMEVSYGYLTEDIIMEGGAFKLDSEERAYALIETESQRLTKYIELKEFRRYADTEPTALDTEAPTEQTDSDTITEP